MKTLEGYTICIVEGNDFTLVLPLKSRTYEACRPIDEDIIIRDLQDVVVKIGADVYQCTLEDDGVHVRVEGTIARGNYSVQLTAKYHGIDIHAAYMNALSIVAWNNYSNAQQYLTGSPVVMPAAYVLGVMTDAETEALKAELRLKIAAAERAKEDADAAKADWEQKAAELDGVAQQGTNPDATNTAILEAVQSGGGDDVARESTSQEILNAVGDILPSQQAVLESYEVLDEKGVAIPSAIDQTIENLPSTIEQINKEFVGYAYLSGLSVRNSPENPKLNFSGVVFTGATLNLANLTHIEEIIAPRTTDALTSFTFNPNNTYNYVDVRLMTTKNITHLNAWGNCKKINASGCDFTGATSAYSMFQNQSRVEWLDFSGTKVSSNLTNSTNCFLSGCMYCTTLVGDHTLQDVIDNNICFFEGLCINLQYFYGMTLLERNSLRAVINGLADLSGQTTQTFQFGATLLAKLTAEDIAIATAKNWSLT